MRSTRAYIAGFGTAGSLLAGASVVFVLASAVVSFHGWPQLDNHFSAPALVRTSSHASADSARSRRLAFVLAAQRPASARVSTSASGSSSALASRLGATPTVATPGRTQVAGVAAPRPTITPVSPAGSPPPCSSGCGAGSPGSSLAGTVQATTGTLGHTVAGSGASLGSTVTGVASTLASSVNALSSSLTGSSVAGSLGQSGQAVGNTVTGAAGAAGTAVAGVGHTAGALLGGH